MELGFNRFIEIVEEAGQCILEMSRRGDYSIGDKGKAGPVTEADLAANRILMKLKNELDGSWYISEESDLDPAKLDSQYVWIIDPIDGTKEFVEGVPEYAVSVALVRSQKIIFSAVYNPHDALDYQIEGELGFKAVSDKGRDNLKGICVSRSEWKRNLFEDFEDFEFHPVGSIAYKLALVARGSFEGVISLRPKNEWDIAGGVGLIQASHKTACDVLGRKFQWNRMCKLEGVLAGDDSFVRNTLATYDLHKAFR